MLRANVDQMRLGASQFEVERNLNQKEKIVSNEAGEKSIEDNSPTKKIVESGMPDLVVDISEIGLDRLLKDIQGDTVGQIPFVKTVYALAKAGYAIKDFFFQKKLIRFVAGFRDANEFLKKKLEQTLPNQQDKQEMGEHLIVALQRFDQITKADALCKLFLARVNGEVTQREFLQFTFVLDKIDFNDLNILKMFYESGRVDREQNDVLRSFAFTKLVSVDYSGRPEAGKVHPRSGGGDEKFVRNGFGEQFIRALSL